MHTVKYFRVINEAEEVFLELPWFLHDPANVGNLISGSSASSVPSLYIWKFLVHVQLKPSLKHFEYNFVVIWNEHNFKIVSVFFGIALLWDWYEHWTFPVLGLTQSTRVKNVVLGCNLKNNRMISFRFQGKPFNIRVIQVYAPNTNAKDAKTDWFYEDLKHLLELTPKKILFFLIGDWNTKVGSQEIPRITGKLALEYRMKQDKG